MNSNDPALMYTAEELIAEDEAAELLHHNNMEAIMAYEQEDGKIAVFVNDKGDNPNRPDMTGRGMVWGKAVEISLWHSTSKSGVDYMSGRIQEPYNGGGASTSSTVHADDVPF